MIRDSVFSIIIMSEMRSPAGPAPVSAMAAAEGRGIPRDEGDAATGPAVRSLPVGGTPDPLPPIPLIPFTPARPPGDEDTSFSCSR